MLLSPRKQKLNMLGLGNSVGTHREGITAEAIVMDSLEELDQKVSLIPGKIVVINEHYVNYGETVKYRNYAAPKAVAYGAVATLIKSVPGKIVVFNEDWVSYGETVKYRGYAALRAAAYGVATVVISVTPFSLNTPHTGLQDYNDSIPKIPVACITAADAHMLRRMYDRGSRLIIKLKMNAQHFPNTISRNTVAEIKGTKHPEKVVIVSGHLDSWDVGTGAMDDAGGAFISWGALAMLSALNLKPERTILLWTGEEVGLIGAYAYAAKHKHEKDNFNLLMESDEGTFNPLGIELGGSDKAACIIQEIMNLLDSINATQLKQSPTVCLDSDIMVFSNNGIPRAILLNENEKYHWYHHTDADTMDVEDSVILDKCLAVWATVAYVVADLTEDLPRKYNFYIFSMHVHK